MPIRSLDVLLVEVLRRRVLEVFNASSGLNTCARLLSRECLEVCIGAAGLCFFSGVLGVGARDGTVVGACPG